MADAATTSTKVLKLYFSTNLGKNAAISITPPAENLTENAVKAVMTTMIATPILPYDLVQSLGAEIVSKETTVVFAS
jgi:hypothetical protein